MRDLHVSDTLGGSGSGPPTDRDEVSRREVDECDG